MIKNIITDVGQVLFKFECYNCLKDITDNEERCVDEDCFSEWLAFKDFYMKFENNRLEISWQPKYWDEDVSEQNAVFDEIESVLIYWAKKFNFTEKLEVFLELKPAVCSEYDADEDGAYNSKIIYLN